MSKYTSTKISKCYRYIKSPVIRPFLKFGLINLLSLNFFKVLESRIIFKYLNPRDKDKICDIACGCGEYSTKLADNGCHIIGIDIDDKSLKIAKAISNEKFIISSAESIPLRSNIFDKVISACALEHFNDDNAALNEMYRILKNDGDLILTVDSFTYDIPKDMLDSHKFKNHVVNYYTRSQLRSKLQNIGFEVKDIKYFVNSPVSVFFLKLSITNIWVCIIFSPLILSIIMLSDKMMGHKDKGIFLAVKAKKTKKN